MNNQIPKFDNLEEMDKFFRNIEPTKIKSSRCRQFEKTNHQSKMVFLKKKEKEKKKMSRIKWLH